MDEGGVCDSDVSQRFGGSNVWGGELDEYEIKVPEQIKI